MYDLLKTGSYFTRFDQFYLYLFVYVLCTAMLIVPTPLNDLRYFICPWIFVAIEFVGKERKDTFGKKEDD